MVGIESRFAGRDRRNERLERVESRIVRGPCRRRRAIGIAGSREIRPIAQHRLRELQLGGIQLEEEPDVEQVLNFGAVVRAKRPERLPVVLTREEVRAVSASWSAAGSGFRTSTSRDTRSP